ncbi:hypothetical protein [Aureivirga sp. CE67]|uniref:hypothetical protein n=1 Tax=Aureivirga sp. CE67 TaxID=1788983 RepID=UPI0018C91381|nr:hypothetical protein [Aureivirga sp. CE67]
MNNKKLNICLFIFLSLTSISFSQNLDFEKFEINGLKFYSSKKSIIEKFGEPTKIFEPNYDCGGLSAHWQNIPFYSLVYENFNFIGNKKDGYLLENVDFNKLFSIIKIKYNKVILNADSTQKELEKLFKVKLKTNGKTLIQNQNDEGIIVELKKGKLTSISYWTSC